MKKRYLYTTESAGKKGIYKFGTTKNFSKSRIKGQQTGNHEKLRYICDFVSDISDTEMHQKLMDMGYHREGDGGNEWFGGFKSEDEAIVVLLKIINAYGKLTLKKYIPRFYQDYIKLVFKQKLESDTNETKEFVLILAPRFGKTLWALDLMVDLFKEYGYKIVAIPAYYLSALSSFEKEFYQHEQFVDNMVFVTQKDDPKKIINENLGKKMIILAISLHIPDYENKYNFLSEIPKNQKVAFIDEADFGCHRENSQKFINFLDCELNIYMTGTGGEKVIAPLTNIGNNIISWSYLDMLMTQNGEHPIQKELL
jgi:hypothetical protein